MVPGLLLSIALSAAPVATNCEDGAENMAQIRACLHDQQREIVDAAYRPMHALLARQDPGMAAELEKSQKSWEKFADDSCAFSVLLDSEMIAGDAQVNCWHDFREARARVLKAWYRKAVARPREERS